MILAPFADTSLPSGLEEHADEALLLLSALAHSKRAVILSALLEGECIAGRLAEIVGVPQATVSQHLVRMRLQVLVATRREGQSVHYRLASGAVHDVLRVLHSHFCASEAGPLEAGGGASERRAAPGPAAP